MEINRCFDVAVIHSISTRENVINDLHEDGYIVQMPEVVRSIYLTPTIDGVPIGWGMITRIRAHTYEGHVLILPEYRAEHAIESVSLMLKWYIDNVKDLKKINTLIPEKWPNITKFFEALGFQREGYVRKSYLKDGKLIGEYMYGVTDDELRKVIYV